MTKKEKTKKSKKSKKKEKKKKQKDFHSSGLKTKKETKNGKKYGKKLFYKNHHQSIKVIVFYHLPDELNFIIYFFSVSFQVSNHVFDFISLYLNY